jgi:hypothetical protein
MNNSSPETGIVNVVLSVTSAAVSLASIQSLVGILAGIVAIISGSFAIRYYYYKTEQIIKTKEDVE